MTTVNEALQEAAETLSNIVNAEYNNYLETYRNEADDTQEIIEPIDNVYEIENTQRFSSAIWFEKIQQQRVTVVGVGGIGSYCAFLLSRVKPRCVYIYDNDIVDPTNLGGQLYSRENIGEKKCNAIPKIVNLFSNYADCYSYDTLFDSHTTLNTDIMICGLDNMESRKLCFNIWKDRMKSHPIEYRENCLYIDGRLNAEEFQVFCIVGDNQYLIDKYESNWLFDDSEAEETVCSYKQTSFTANMIASVMVNLFVNFCANLCNPIVERDLPFMTRYDATTMFFKTE